MKKEQLKNIKADEPLSLTDAAPPVIELDCGVRVRLPSFGDFRILGRIEHDVKECDDIDTGVIMLYCAMHTNKSDIAKLWKMARDPKKMYDKVTAWQLGQPAAKLGAAINELSEYVAETNDQADMDGDGEEDSDAKKKTG